MNRNNFYIYTSLILITLLSGCAAGNKLTPQATNVRVTNNPDVVAKCDYVKSIVAYETNWIPLFCDTLESCTIDLQNQAASYDCDVVYIVSESGNPSYVSMRADLYNCNCNNKFSSKNENLNSIYQAQQKLTSFGYNPGPIDGIMGNQLKNALLNFQKKRGLPETGQLDETTKKALDIN